MRTAPALRAAPVRIRQNDSGQFMRYINRTSSRVSYMPQKDDEVRNIMLTDAKARDKATRHFFNRALRDAREIICNGALS